MFRTWAWDLYSDYKKNAGEIDSHHEFKRNFKNSVFSACGFNFGRETCTRPHTDSMNLAYGLCAITPLGQSDYRKGGHLVLWDLGIISEFPPGTTALIPSAAITHSNTLVSMEETRYSVTQFTAAGLFQLAENDFVLVKNGGNKVMGDKWLAGISLLPTIAKIQELTQGGK